MKIKNAPKQYWKNGIRKPDNKPQTIRMRYGSIYMLMVYSMTPIPQN
jgi:hypothetical protein